jgi:hypothetical protein
MDLSTIAAAPISGASSATGVSGQIDLSVLNSVQQLQAALANELFSSIGLGGTVDTHA